MFSILSFNNIFVLFMVVSFIEVSFVLVSFVLVLFFGLFRGLSGFVMGLMLDIIYGSVFKILIVLVLLKLVILVLIFIL